MSTVRRPRRRQVGQRPAPGPMRLRLRWLAAWVYGPFVRAFRSRRTAGAAPGPAARGDESGIVGRVGSRPANPGSRRKHNLWIPPSTGWTALDRRAQQLVADVLLLLNLAERGDPIQREQRLRRTDRNRLPPCLAGDRSPLDASRTIGMARSSDPGPTVRTAALSSCARILPRASSPTGWS